ncbi:MAG: catalase [Acidimicrobiales bacterium]
MNGSRGPVSGWDDLSNRLVDAIISDFPDHQAGTRPIHTTGIGATGYFQPTDVAPSYSAAEQFAGGKVPVTVRFSNGSGSPVEHDSRPDARGMATKFHLTGDREADLIMMTLPVFFVRNTRQFLKFSKDARPEVVPPQTRWQKLLDQLQLRSPAPEPDAGTTTTGVAGMLRYASRHTFANPSLIFMSTLVTPVSYARAKYHAVHTFRATDGDGHVRHVRLAWEPVAGVRPIAKADAATLPPDFLHTELRQRLARRPARFVLRMHLAGQGDALDDPTVIWDNTQPRVVMGELVLTDVVADQEAGCERLSFNPGRVVPGLECSDDPILLARLGAYEESCRRRGGTGCPVGSRP